MKISVGTGLPKGFHDVATGLVGHCWSLLTNHLPGPQACPSPPHCFSLRPLSALASAWCLCWRSDASPHALSAQCLLPQESADFSGQWSHVTIDSKLHVPSLRSFVTSAWHTEKQMSCSWQFCRHTQSLCSPSSADIFSYNLHTKHTKYKVYSLPTALAKIRSLFSNWPWESSADFFCSCKSRFSSWISSKTHQVTPGSLRTVCKPSSVWKWQASSYMARLNVYEETAKSAEGLVTLKPLLQSIVEVDLVACESWGVSFVVLLLLMMKTTFLTPWPTLLWRTTRGQWTMLFEDF